jgi:hypothetical protein
MSLKYAIGIYSMATLPQIHYRFDSNTGGNNTGTSGANNLTLVRDTLIDTTNELIGTGCLGIFSADAGSTTNNQTVMSGTFTVSTSHVISFWFKTNTAFQNQTFFSMFKAGAYTTALTINMNGAQPRLYFTGYNSVTYDIYVDNLFDNNWHHVYWACNGTTHAVTIDGSPKFSGINIGSTPNNTVVSKIAIGADCSNYTKPLSGYIDDFRIWTTGSAPSVDYIYKLGKNTDVAGLSGASITDLYYAGATPPQQLVAGKTISAIQTTYGYTIVQMYDSGVTFPQLVNGGIAISTLLTAPNNYSISQLYAGGITIAQFITASYTISQLYAGGITIAQFIAASYSVIQLISGGITIDNLLAASYTYTQLIDNSVTKTQFDSGGKTIQNLIAGGVTISKLVTAQYSFSQMIAGGVTSTQFTEQGYSITNLLNGGANNTELLLAGYSLVELQSVGVLPAWNIDTTANHLIKSYFRDFVDVSGSIVLRENSNLYVNGNVETAGNVSLNSVVVEADASFNRRIFVGGDVSMNGSLIINGDLSLNGSVTKCNLNNSSIPKSAFASAVPDGPDYNTSKIVYGQTFQANDDVSMNGLTVSANNVTVSGNIIFGDGTVMNAYDNNISTTNAPAFNPSTFTRLDICGNLVAGSYASLSDYRIKTNIMVLDETYTVDKLRPVKYYQTLINREKYGLIAHELQEHYPELVVGEKDGSELQRVNYTGLIAILINEIKRMKLDLAELENKM